MKRLNVLLSAPLCFCHTAISLLHFLRTRRRTVSVAAYAGSCASVHSWSRRFHDGTRKPLTYRLVHGARRLAKTRRLQRYGSGVESRLALEQQDTHNHHSRAFAHLRADGHLGHRHIRRGTAPRNPLERQRVAVVR